MHTPRYHQFYFDFMAQMCHFLFGVLMKMLKVALLFITLGTVATAHAQTETITTSLESTNFEYMSISSLAVKAAQGDHHAQFFLAKRLQKGEGVAKDAVKAAYWYTRAAEHNIAPAQLNLGIMYLRGEGIKADMDEGRKWLEKAANLGDNRASYALAMIDEKQQRLVDAYKWYDLSTREGMLDQKIKNKAQNKIGQLALNLSSSDIQKAKNSADSWFQIK